MPPPSDYRFVDRLGYMFNGAGFIYDRVAHLWLVDAATGEARRLTDGPPAVDEPAWSPDGTRIVFTTNLRRDHDLATARTSCRRRRHAGRPADHGAAPLDLRRADVAARRLDGRRARRRYRARRYRNDVWLFAADGSDARRAAAGTFPARHDLMPGASMISDIVPAKRPRLVPSADGRWLTFRAPIDGAYELGGSRPPTAPSSA